MAQLSLLPASKAKFQQLLGGWQRDTGVLSFEGTEARSLLFRERAFE